MLTRRLPLQVGVLGVLLATALGCGSHQEDLDSEAADTTGQPVVAGGLSGTYFKGTTLATPVLERVDPTVNFDWGKGTPASALPSNSFSVRWTGFVVPKFSQTYTFYTVSDDGVRLWVNDKLLINHWNNHSSTEDRATISLTAGERYPIKMEYYENTGSAVAKLLWSSASQPKQAIPKEQLFSGTSSASGSCAEANEGSSVALSCPSGQTIARVDFASYGVPTGSCPAGFSTGTCHAASSLNKVQTSCVGKQSCSVAATNSFFGDPCVGTFKKLGVVYTCGGGSTDACPADPNKTSPGICGCGVADTDSDNDGTANCKDACPADSHKTAPGLCGCGVPEGTCSGPSAQHLVLAPNADAYVDSANSANNFGGAGELLVDKDPAIYHTVLRFTVPTLTAELQSAKIRLFVSNPSPDGPKVYRTDNTWTEGGVTWSNRPSPTGGVIADVAAVSTGWLEIDVTQAIVGAGDYSFLLLPDSGDGADFGSREGANKPELVVDTGQQEEGIRYVAYGDSRSSISNHEKVLNAIAKRNPELVLHTGDLWDGYSATAWRNAVTKNAGLADLLNQNLFLVARGNHESVSEVLQFSPRIVRENAEMYSFTHRNTFFVSLGYATSSAAAFLEQRLKTTQAANATWRVVFSHAPVYSAGSHGANGISAIEKLCDRYNVNLFFNGHDHIYERSHQMYGQQISDDGNQLDAAAGTVYVVAGGGGAPLYSAGSINSTHTAASTLHFIEITATSTTLTQKAIKPDGTVFDTFTLSR